MKAIMALLSDFESQLKEIVTAKRLSASKVTKLTEIALKSMKDDVQLRQSKIHSLYVFDALSRAARHQVNKHELSAGSSQGNAATFLSKVEGILEGLFQDMLSTGKDEFKEKTKKILDIWVKANTFPAQILSSLTKTVKDSEKVPEKSLVSSDPRNATLQSKSVTPPATQSPPVQAADPQSTLLALLLQQAAKPALNGQTAANTTGTTAPQLELSQLAILQQLAQTAQRGNGGVGAPAPPPTNFVNVTNVPDPRRPAASLSPIPLSDQRYRPIMSPNSHDIPRHDRYNGSGASPSEHRSGYRDHDRNNGRGSRDTRDRFKEKDMSPRRSGHSRRGVRPYSPPRRPNVTESSGDGEKDEFGRDVRPRSQSPEAEPKQQSATQPPPAVSADTLPTAPYHESPPSPSTTTIELVQPAEQPVGLEAFNPQTFDPTSPAAWESFGKMWEVTNGQPPSQEQLMQYLMTAMSGVMGIPQQNQYSGWQAQGQYVNQQQFQKGRGDGFTRGRGRGRGGFSQFSHEDPGTEAIVLGGGSDMQTEYSDKQASSISSSGGSMQNIGGKWVFVRDGAPP
ncbi:uncharacterized protein EV420DRAFT_1626384 [Desarmillaria tabescens]|uniref:CID domain-containing protein n=1 Tax=Armillaria tabescens TaxID=1929756 RepID=A0AA39NJV2_ARMTA|nr:uncharacterized protein EV420DRAFT_1626384 [Desarmillaria tabescens]KAK0466956.1 hypothetical protein EV420DRAFT_1626384 [Desarmillaria tabescens]